MREAARNTPAGERAKRDTGLRPVSAPRRTLRLTLTASLGKAFVPTLRKHLKAAHALLAPPLAELSVALVNDRTMSDLHVRFMGIAGPTDVLTFPLDEDDGGNVTAGEVVVCVPEAKRRAKAEGHDAAAEVLLYALHGMLHLCGHDDKTAAGYRRMHRTEDDILAQLGVGPVFDRGRRPRRGGTR